MCGEPVGAGAVFYEDGDIVGKGESGFHDVDDFGDKFLFFVRVEVEDEFVVDL